MAKPHITPRHRPALKVVEGRFVNDDGLSHSLRTHAEAADNGAYCAGALVLVAPDGTVTTGWHAGSPGRSHDLLGGVAGLMVRMGASAWRVG